MKDLENSNPVSNRLESFYSYVNRIVRKFRFDDQTCMDVIQEVLMKVYAKSDSFSGKSEIKTWIFSVTRNHCINYKKRIYEKNFRDLYFMDCDPVANDAGDYDVMNTLKEALLPCLRTLPDHLLNPLVHFYYENMKYSEISSIMGIPIGTVKSRINVAKKRLKALIEKYVEWN